MAKFSPQEIREVVKEVLLENLQQDPQTEKNIENAYNSVLAARRHLKTLLKYGGLEARDEISSWVQQIEQIVKNIEQKAKIAESTQKNPWSVCNTIKEK